MSQRPFRFFADYDGELRADVWRNREREAISFGGFPAGFGPEDIPDPSAPSTFEGCKLIWDRIERGEVTEWRNFLKRLLMVRREYIVPLLGPDLRGGKALDAPDDCIFVDWAHPSGALRLRANLGEEQVVLGAEVGHGTEIYPATAREGNRALDARTVRVFFRQPT